MALGRKGISNAQLKAALKAYSGAFALAALELGTSRQNIEQRVKRSPELQRYIAELEEEVLDAAEAVVKDAILAKDHKMTRWFLERKGKKRGYALRVEAGFSDATLEAIVASFGGDLGRLRSLRDQLGGAAAGRPETAI